MPTNSPYPLRGSETITIVQDGYEYRDIPLYSLIDAICASKETSFVLDAYGISRGLIPALSPNFASLAGGAAAGTLVATITGFLTGETLERISPADGRLAINGAGTGVTKGASVQANGVKDYTLVTTRGRRLPLQVTTTGAPS